MIYSVLHCLIPLVALAGQPTPQTSVHAIAESGDPAPGLEGRKITHVREPRLTEGGRVAFIASLDGPPADDLPTKLSSYSGVWSGTPDNLDLIALSGTLADGFDDHVYTLFWRLLVNETGSLVLVAQLGKTWELQMDKPSLQQMLSGGMCIERRTANRIELLAHENMPIPDQEPRMFRGLGRSTGQTRLALPALNVRSDVTFFADFQGEGFFNNLAGIWIAPVGGGLRCLVSSNETVIGTGNETDGDRLDQFNLLNAQALSPNGDVAFYGGVTDPDGGHGYTAIWHIDAANGGTLANARVVANTRMNAPDTEDRFSQILRPTIGPNGAIAFTARLWSTEHVGFSSTGLWIDRAGTLETVVSPLPPSKDSVNPKNHVYIQRFTPDGDLIYVHGRDLWRWNGKESSLVWDATDFEERHENYQITAVYPRANAAGDLVVCAEFTDPDCGVETQTGFWFRSSGDGSLDLIARTGVGFAFAHTPEAAVLRLDRFHAHLNKGGQFLFLASFEGGSSGIYLVEGNQ